MFAVSAEMKAKVQQRITECAAIVAKTYNSPLPMVTVRYDINSSRLSGQAIYRDMTIRLNPVYLNQYGDEYIEDTVTHEVAHLATYFVWKTVRKMHRTPQAHGDEWRDMMRLFGVTPNRCHSYKVPEGVSVGKQKAKFNYTCSCCGEIVVTGPKVHANIQRGHSYSHAKCRGSKLVFVAAAGRVSYSQAKQQGIAPKVPVAAPKTVAPKTVNVPIMPKTGTKIEQCYSWFKHYKASNTANFRQTCIAVFMQEVGMTAAGASTYYSTCVKLYEQGCNMKRRDVIMRVAKATRKWAERAARKHNKSLPNIGEQINDDLCGFCAIASAKLLQRLHESGIKNARVAINDCHCFVLWQGHVIDITATQFPGLQDAPVVFAKRLDLCEEHDLPVQGRETGRNWWHPAHEFHDVEALVDYQQRVGWPDYQIAFKG